MYLWKYDPYLWCLLVAATLTSIAFAQEHRKS